jgi:hypothetical protein
MTFKIGDKVVDRAGFSGTIIKIVEWQNNVYWYNVRFTNADGYSPGVAVRYASDLRLMGCEQ